MSGRSPLCNRRDRASCAWKVFFILVLVSMNLIRPGFSTAAFINGGDALWSFRDQAAGKQDPVASVIDSQGNTIITGSRLLPGSSYEECYTIKVSPAGALVWRAAYSKPGFDVKASAIAVDAQDNVYVTGTVLGANADVFTIRYDSSQATVNAIASWQMPFDGGLTDMASSIAVDGEYVYVGGSSRFGGNECFMVLKYNRADGTLLFQIPNAATAVIGKAYSVAANASGVAVTGQSWSGADLYMKTLSYNSAGQFLWEKQYSLSGPPPQGFNYNDAGRFVRLDSKGHVAVAGYVSNGTDADIYTVKYCNGNTPPCDGKNPGDMLWEQTYAGPDEAKPDGLVIERQADGLDDVYMTGRSFINGRYHMYTARYKSAVSEPQKSWDAIFTSGSDNHDIPVAMAVSASEDSLYITGHSEDAAENDDIRTVKYRKSSGRELWKQTFKGAADRNDLAVGVGVDAAGQVYVAGFADETSQLDNGSATSTNSTNPKTVLVDGTKNWTGIDWRGLYVMFTGSNNQDEYRKIVFNDATSLTLNTPLPNDIAAGDAYYIFDQDDYDYYVVKYEKGVLEAPSGLVATTASNSSINLNWHDNNITTPKFRLERCTNYTEHLVVTPCDFDNPAEITVVADGISATSSQDTGLVQHKYYYYRVRAYTGTDFASATMVTYPSNIDHAVTQYVAISSPSKTYNYAGVANNDDYSLAIAVSPVDGSPVVTGKSFFTPGGMDYYTIRLDRDLNKQWSQRYNGAEGKSDVAVTLAVDSNDQIIVSGYSMLMNLTANADMNSVYTIKYKANAAPEPEVDTDLINDWAHQYNGPGGGDDRAVAIAAAADAANNIAVIGMGLHSSSIYNKRDMYVLHYPSSGPGTTASPNPGYWAATPIHEGDDNQPTAVAFDPWGNVIVTGFTGNVINPLEEEAVFSYDIYTAKFCGSSTSGCPNGKNPGDLIWKRTYDGLHGDDEANDVVVDPSGNVYVAGFTNNGQGNWDYITLKYDRDGNLQANWPKIYDGPAHGDDEAVSIKYDHIDKSVVVAGNRLTDAGNNDLFAVRYRASDGAVLWNTALLREHNDEEMFEMDMDTSGNVFITGTTTNAAGTDIITVKLDWEGSISGSVTMHGSADLLEKPYDIASNFLGEVFIAGIAQNGSGNADYLVLKLNGPDVLSPYPVNYTTPSYTSVTLSWPDFAGLKGGHYHLKRKAGSCEDENNNNPETDLTASLLSPSSTTFTDTGLSQSSLYCYSVQHENGTLSRWTPKTVVTSTPTVPAPVNVAAVDTTTIRVSWTATSSGHTGFEVERCVDSDGNTPCSNFSHLYTAVAADASYLDTTVCAGSVYRYRLKATGAGWDSAFSATAGAIPPSVSNWAVDPGVETPDPLAAGQGVGWTYVGGTIASDISFDRSEKHNGSQSLNINAVGTATISGIKQYLLFAPSGKYQVSAWFKSAAASGQVTCDLLDGSSGSFTNSGTTSNWEQRALTITTSATAFPGGSRIRCYAATGSQVNIDDLQATSIYELTAVRYSETQIDLAWIDSTFDETGYKIERCADPNSSTPCTDFQYYNSVGANVTTYRDSRLTPETTYRYRIYPYKQVSGVCNGGWNNDPLNVIPSTYSNAVFAKTTNNLPVLTAAAPNTTQVALTWTDTTNTESGFQIARGSGSDCASLGNLAQTSYSSGTGLSINYNDTTVCNSTTYSYCIKPLSLGSALPDGTLWVPVAIANPQSNFQTKLMVTSGQLPGVKPDFSDIRIYDVTASEELPYWVESISPGSAATIWFKTKSATDKVYLFYGNPAATTKSDGASVFEFFDGFDGTSLSAQWNPSITGASTITVGGGEVMLNAPSYTNASLSKGLTPPYRLEARTKVSSTYLGTGLIRVRGLGGIGDTGLFDMGSSVLVAYFNSANSAIQIPVDQYIRWRADHTGGASNIWSIFADNGTQIYTKTYTGSPSGISLSAGDGGGGNGKFSVDWIFARKYVAVEPVATLGTPSVADNDVVAGLTYRQFWDGPYSKPTAGATAPAPTIITTPAKPGAPTLLAAGVKRFSEAQIDITWTFPTGKDQEGFKIDRCSASDCTTGGGNTVTPISVLNAAVATGTAGTFKHSDKGLVENKTYYYRVRGYKTEDPACNSGLGYWETVSSGIFGDTTTLQAALLAGTGGVSTDCADIRFTDDSNVKQEYFLQSGCDTNNTVFNVKVVSIPANGKTLYLYHGNQLAQSASDGSKVFNFFDGFDGTAIDGSKWTITDGTGFSVSDGFLHGQKTTGRLTSKSTAYSAAGYTLQAMVRAPTQPQDGYVPAGFFNNNWYYNIGWLDYPGAHHYSKNNGYVANPTTPPAGSARSDTMLYSLQVKSSTVFAPSVYDVDKSVPYWTPGDLTYQYYGLWPIVIGRRYDSDSFNNQVYDAYWDWVRVRQYRANAPTASIPGAYTVGSFSPGGESGTWKYRRPVTISYDAAGATLNNFQVDITMDTTALGTNRNILTWTTKTDTETSFTLERCKDTTENCTSNFSLEKTVANLPAVNKINSPSRYTDADIPLDSQTVPINYCYRVKAINSAWSNAATPGESGYSNIVCMSTKLQAAPSNLQAVKLGTTINLSWTDNSEGESGFTLERCQDNADSTPCDLNGGNNTVISIPPNDESISGTASYADANLCAGTYRYRISAFKNNPDGTGWLLGPFPNDGIGVVATTDLTPAPVNVVVSRVSEQQMRVTWTDKSSDEAGFQVWRCTAPSGTTPGVDSCTNYLTEFEMLPITKEASTTPIINGTVTYNDTYALVPGNTYRYMVKAFTSGTCGAASASSPPNLGGPDFATLTIPAPSGATATPVNTTQVDLAWTDLVGSESGYMVGRCSPAPCSTTPTTFPLLPVDSGTYSDTSACAGTGYTYTIYPINATTFNNPGTNGCWKSYSPVTFTKFKPNFITRIVVSRDPGIVDGTEKKADFTDIRFYDRDALKEIPSWIQSYSGNTAIVWIKTGYSEGIDLYYGNAVATYDATASKNAVFGTGLVGYWPFEETSQLPVTTNDYSGLNNNLMMSAGFAAPNGIVDSGGKYGKVLSLDGAGDYAYKAGAITGLPAGNPVVASAEAWVYPDWDPALPPLTTRSPYDYNGIVSWGNRTTAGGFAMSLNSAAVPQFAGWNNDYTSPGAALVPGTWNHLAVVINGTSGITYYVNGAPLLGTLSSGLALNLASSNLAIGALQLSAGDRNFKGMIDEVRLYNRALGAADIAARYADDPPQASVGGKVTPGGCLSSLFSHYTGTSTTANAVTEIPGNLAKNKDFENDLTGWGTWSQTTRTGFSADTTLFFSGKKSAKLTETNLPAGNGSTIYQSVVVVPGGKYVLSGYINARLAAGGTAWCNLTNWNSDINWGSAAIRIDASDSSKNNKGWFPLTANITIPPVAPNGGLITYASLECGIWTSATATNTANFDAIQLTPDPPIVLSVPRSSEAEVFLRWNNFPAEKTAFNVYRCNSTTTDCSDVTTFVNFTKLNGTGLLVDNYLDSTVALNQDYRYVVRANKTATCAWNIPSNVVSVSTSINTSWMVPVLATPVPLSSTSMKLSWNDPATSESGYNIYRCTGSGCEPCPGGCSSTTPFYPNQSVGISNVLNQALKVNYTFNGTLNDSSSSGLNITPNRTPTYTDGGFNLESQCGESTSPVTDILNTDQHTLDFEIKFNAANPGWYSIFRYPAGGDRSPGIWTSTVNRLYWRYNPLDKGINLGSTGDNGPEFEIGKWYRIRGVKNGSSFKVYVNEVLVHSSTNILPAVKTPGSARLVFGGSCWSPSLSMRNFRVYSSFAEPNDVTFTDTQVCPDSSYSYRVEPVKDGSWTGAASNGAGNTTLIFNPPGGLTASISSASADTWVDLAITPGSGNEQTGYLLKECPGANCTNPMSIPNAPSYTSQNLTGESNYCYQVAARKATTYCNGVGGGDATGISTAFIPASPVCITTYTKRPTGLSADPIGPYKIKLDWQDESGNEEVFELQTRIWNGQWVTRNIIVKDNVNGIHSKQFIDTVGIQPLNTYSYRIRAISGTQKSPFSNEATVTTPAFTGGDDKATCICTSVDGKEVCK